MVGVKEYPYFLVGWRRMLVLFRETIPGKLALVIEFFFFFAVDSGQPTKEKDF